MRADSPQWIVAKAEGDRAELAIAKWFKRYGWQPFKSIGNAEFDLLLQCEVEVKHDRMASDTGNLAIEVAYRGQPSGIMTSRAKWWVIVVGSLAVIIKTDKLQKFVLAGKFREVPAGDGKLATVRLVPLDRLKEHSKAHVVKVDETDASDG